MLLPKLCILRSHSQGRVDKILEVMREIIAQSLRSPTASTQRADKRNGDHALNTWPMSDGPLKPASVLVPLVERPSGYHVLLTQRAAHLKNHAGQISFPGGRQEPEDASVVATALRETHEEIGLAAKYICVAGLLDTYETRTGYLVTPVVGFVRHGFELALDSFEVAHAFEVPLEFIMDPTNHVIESRPCNGAQRRYYVLQYEQHYIWGATAGMLVDLYRRIHNK
jgi:8-oxo-dGTP pyrophosphatase MutT (NUDIX family)